MLLLLAFILLFCMLPIGGWLIDDKDSWAGQALINIILVAFIFWAKEITVVTFIRDNPTIMAKMALSYIAFGIVWAMVKFHRRSTKIKAGDLLKIYARNTPLESIKMEAEELFNDLFKKVPIWIAFWPWVLTWDILSDFLKSFFEWIADLFKGCFKWIFNWTIKSEHAKAVSIMEDSVAAIKKNSKIGTK